MKLLTFSFLTIFSALAMASDIEMPEQYIWNSADYTEIQQSDVEQEFDDQEDC
jgi:hypothetical protein